MSDSSADRTLDHLLAAWRRAVASSLLVRSLRRLGERTDAAVDGSALARGVRTLERWIRASWLYRWLTAEPDPEVIVIDLRETYTVGPIVAVLDRVGSAAAGWWEHSTSRVLLDRLEREARDAPIRVASVALIGVLGAELAVSLAAGAMSGTGIALRAGVLVLALSGTQVTTPWERLRTTRPVRLLRAVLEPPEPPESDRSDDE